MDKFNNTIITNVGRKLLNNVSGGQGKITYTKAVLYNQDISSLSDEDLMALTSLSGDVVTTNISIVKVTDTTVTAEASFTNAKLTQDVTFNAIGWFASVVPGDDETLIAVTPSATTQTLVAGSNGKATASVDFKLLMGISHDAQVHLTTNEAGTIDQTHLDNALRDLAAKGLINQGEDIGNDVDISQIHNTSIQTANGTDLTNMPKDYSNHGYLISIGSNDTTKDGIHVLYDTQKNIQYVQYFNNKTNKWTDWLANSTEQDLKDLKKSLDDLIATKADSSDVTTLQNQVDSKTSGTIVTAYDVASKNPTTVKNSYTSEELVDQGALGQFADQINQLKGRQAVDAPDFNTLTDTGVYFIAPDGGKNFPLDHWGTLAVFNGTNGTVIDTKITQLYFTDDGVSAFVRMSKWVNNAAVWGSWNQIAWTSDITNLQNTVNGKANSTDITNLQNQVTALQQNSHKIVPITQADYDALSTKDPNTIYAIGG